MEEPLVNQEYELRKFPGKGGWTYAEIPEIAPDPKAHFGWVTVRGRIDGYELKKYRLMPLGNGRLFLPVKAEIRKQIAKQAGDYVWVTLFADPSPREIPTELAECLQTEPPAYDNFRKLSAEEQNAYLDWIYSARTEETRVARLVKTIDNVLQGHPFRKTKS